MRLFQSKRGISSVALILLLLISFIIGAVLSYMWTIGYYVSSEYSLPSQANITIENVQFSPENTTLFNVTVLNPSYSSNVTIEQIKVETITDGNIHDVVTTMLPFKLSRGTSQTFTCIWNWGNYTGHALNVIVLLSEGSGATLKASTPIIP
jgi:hypothetical protein